MTLIKKDDRMQNEKPMMAQYRRIKEQHNDCILLFRLGGFYEIFNRDAYTVFKVLGLKITSRNSGYGILIPMCGIPIRAAGKHAQALTEKGYKVAICDQVDGESEGGVIKREVTEIVHPDESAQAVPPIADEEYAAYLAEFEAQAKMLTESRRIVAKGPVKPVSALSAARAIIKELNGINLDDITPAAALQLLYKWKRTYSDPYDGLREDLRLPEPVQSASDGP
jgi:DNA mismatch repair protein MutS